MFDIFVISANAIPSQQNLDNTVWQLACFRSQRFGFATVATRKRWDRSLPPSQTENLTAKSKNSPNIVCVAESNPNRQACESPTRHSVVRQSKCSLSKSTSARRSKQFTSAQRLKATRVVRRVKKELKRASNLWRV